MLEHEGFYDPEAKNVKIDDFDLRVVTQRVPEVSKWLILPKTV